MSKTKRSLLRRCQIVAIVALVFAGFGALPATSSAGASCKSPLLYPPRSGGFALIIFELRVSRVSCRQGLKVAGAYSAGEKMPRGWRCQRRKSGRIACRRDKARLSYYFGGDAG